MRSYHSLLLTCFLLVAVVAATARTAAGSLHQRRLLHPSSLTSTDGGEALHRRQRRFSEKQEAKSLTTTNAAIVVRTLRGGGGGGKGALLGGAAVKPAPVAAAMAAFTAARGLAHVHSCKALTESQGIVPGTKSDRMLTARQGTMMLSFAVTALLAICYGMDPVCAVGYGMLPMTLYVLQATARGDMVREWDIPRSTTGTVGLIVLTIIYGCVAGTSWGRTAVKVFAILHTLQAVVILYSPQQMFSNVAVNKKSKAIFWKDRGTRTLARQCGIVNFALDALINLLIVRNVPPVESVAYATIPVLAFNLWCLTLAGDDEHIIGSKSTLAAFMAIQTAAVAFILLSSSQQ